MVTLLAWNNSAKDSNGKQVLAQVFIEVLIEFF